MRRSILAVSALFAVTASANEVAAAADKATAAPVVVRGTVLAHTAFDQDGTRMVLARVRVDRRQCPVKACVAPLRLFVPATLAKDLFYRGATVEVVFAAETSAVVTEHLSANNDPLEVLEGTVSFRKLKKSARRVGASASAALPVAVDRRKASARL